MSVLIICEKPSVAKTVALALGAAEQKDGYLSGDGLLVSWCIGHLISMADAGSYDERYKKSTPHSDCYSRNTARRRRRRPSLASSSLPCIPPSSAFSQEIRPYVIDTKEDSRCHTPLSTNARLLLDWTRHQLHSQNTRESGFLDVPSAFLRAGILASGSFPQIVTAFERHSAVHDRVGPVGAFHELEDFVLSICMGDY